MSQTGAAEMFVRNRQTTLMQNQKQGNRNKRKRKNHRSKNVSMEQQAKMWKKPW